MLICAHSRQCLQVTQLTSFTYINSSICTLLQPINPGNFNRQYVDCGYAFNNPNSACLANLANKNVLDLLYNLSIALSFYSGRFNSGSNTDLAFLNLGQDSNDKSHSWCVLEKFLDFYSEFANHRFQNGGPNVQQTI